jgi:hypothetical protein
VGVRTCLRSQMIISEILIPVYLCFWVPSGSPLFYPMQSSVDKQGKHQTRRAKQA